MCKRNTKNIIPRVSKTIYRRIMFLPKCAVFNSEKWRFMKEKEPS